MGKTPLVENKQRTFSYKNTEPTNQDYIHSKSLEDCKQNPPTRMLLDLPDVNLKPKSKVIAHARISVL